MGYAVNITDEIKELMEIIIEKDNKRFGSNGNIEDVINNILVAYIENYEKRTRQKIKTDICKQALSLVDKDIISCCLGYNYRWADGVCYPRNWVAGEDPGSLMVDVNGNWKCKTTKRSGDFLDLLIVRDRSISSRKIAAKYIIEIAEGVGD